MENVEITKKDRVFLINQYRILAALYPDDANHYNELIEILQSGYMIFYSKIDEWIFEDMKYDEGKLVIDILNVYRAIEDLKRNNPSETLSSNYNSYFKGFDGNNETEYMSFARFLINEQGKFTEQKQYFIKNDSMNSHIPMISKYKKMINKWKELDNKFQLSEEQALEIINVK